MYWNGEGGPTRYGRMGAKKSEDHALPAGRQQPNFGAKFGF